MQKEDSTTGVYNHTRQSNIELLRIHLLEKNYMPVINKLAQVIDKKKEAVLSKIER